MAEWLRDNGYHSLFLDVDPEAGLVAGREWEQQLYRRLRSCRAVIVLCSPHSMVSDWCFAEITHARSLGKEVFPVRIADCVIRPVLSAVQFVDLTVDAEAGYAQLRRGLEQVLGARDLEVWDRSRSPYPGLLAFQEADAPIFFGRDDDVRDTVAWLTRLDRFAGARLALLLGASGCGKSSLVRAGVVPLLRRDREHWLVVEPFRPLRDPWGELTQALIRTFERLKAPDDAVRAAVASAAAQEAPDGLVLVNVLGKLRAAADQPDAACLLVIDQLEELLGGDAAEPAGRFVSFLRSALEVPDTPLMVLGTLRSDLLGRFQTHPIGALPYAETTVRPLTLQGFARAIEGPAELAELALEAGLVHEMVADTGTDDALPLLAFTLRELWERYGHDGRLSLDDYRNKLGRLQGSLARAAETALTAHRLGRAQVDALRTAFLRLVRVNEEGKYVRRQAAWDELPAESHAVLQRFIDARLVVPRDRAGRRTVEVAHEALFRAWDQLRTWLDEDASLLQVHDAIRRAADDWAAGGRDADLLVHRGPRLAAAEALVEGARFSLSEVERNYIEACVRRRQGERAEREEQRRRELEAEKALAEARRQRLEESEHLRRLAEERQAQAEVELYMSSILLSQQYIEKAQYELATRWLMDCPEHLRNWEWGYLLGLAHLELPAAPVAGVSYDLPLVSTGGMPVTFDLFEWEWGDAGPEPRRVRESFADRAFSRDGRWAVIRGEGLEADARLPRLVETRTGRVVTHLGPHPAPVQNAAFSHDGERVATAAGLDVWIWQAHTGERLGVLHGHTDTVWAVAFSPDGTRLVTASDDGTARIWDPAKGRELVTLRKDAHWRFRTVDRSDAMSLYSTRTLWRNPRFSPDGRSVAVQVEDELMLFGTYPFRVEHLASAPGTSWPERLDAWRREHDRARRQRTWAVHPAPDERPVFAVGDVQQFVSLIGPDRILELAPDRVFDVNEAPDAPSSFVRWHPADEGRTLIVHDVQNLTIRGRTDVAPGSSRRTHTLSSSSSSAARTSCWRTSCAAMPRTRAAVTVASSARATPRRSRSSTASCSAAAPRV